MDPKMARGGTVGKKIAESEWLRATVTGSRDYRRLSESLLQEEDPVKIRYGVQTLKDWEEAATQVVNESDDKNEAQDGIRGNSLKYQVLIRPKIYARFRQKLKERARKNENELRPLLEDLRTFRHDAYRAFAILNRADFWDARDPVARRFSDEIRRRQIDVEEVYGNLEALRETIDKALQL